MALFDQSAETYDFWCSIEIGSVVDKLEKDIIFQSAQPQKGEKVLDLGCGTGIYSIWLAKMGLDVTGVDIAENMLTIASKKAAGANLNIEFIQSDIHQLPFGDQTFDLVVANIVLEFTENPQKVVHEAMRVLKKGGRFVCGMIGKDSAWGRKYQLRAKEKAGSVFATASFFTPEDVKNGIAIPPDEIQLGLFFSEEEFINSSQAIKLENERTVLKNEEEAGYFAVRWNKPVNMPSEN